MMTGLERDELWGEVEHELRRFVQLFDTQPEWLWEAETVKMVRAVRPRLDLLDGAGRVAGSSDSEAAVRWRPERST